MARMSLQAAFDQARQWLESNDLDRAIGLSEHILQSYPNNLEAHRLLGEASLANRQLDQAQESFEYILSADPENIPAHVGLGVTLERRGKLEQAVREFEQALEIKPDMPELRSQVLRLYTEGGIDNPQLRLSHAGLARLYAKGQMLPQAVNEFRKVIKNQPERYDTRVALAETLWNNEQEEESAALSRALLSERPNLVKPHLLLGYMQLASGEHEGAQHWQSAADFDPYMNIAQSIFEVLPDMEQPNLEIDSWDEAAWRKRRVEEQEQIAATRPMEVAQTPTQQDFVPGVGFFNPSETAPSFNASESDDFLASLLSLEAAPAKAAESIAPATPPVAEPVVAPAVESEEDLDIASMKPFSLADLGLTDDELAGLDSLDSFETQATASETVVQPEQRDTTEFASLQDDFATLDTLDSFDDHPAPVASAEPVAPAVESSTPPVEDEESDELDLANVRPFSFSELGLDDDEIASLQSLETLDDEASVDVKFPLLTEEDDDLADMSSDLQPFSIDEIEQSGLIPGDLQELPPSLQPFSLDEPGTVGRPRVSGLTPDMGLDESVGDDDTESDQPGFGWQAPPIRPEPDFVSSLRETDPPPGSSLFHKLQQQRQNNPPPAAPASAHDTISIGENEDMGLFSLDNEPLRDDLPEPPRESPLIGLAQREGTARSSFEAPPVVPPTPSSSSASDTEEGDLQGAIAAGDIQPFSLADLGLSDEEIAALGIESQTAVSLPSELEEAPEQSEVAEEITFQQDSLVDTDEAESEEFFNIDSLDFSEDDLPDFNFETSPPQPASSPAPAQHAAPVEIDSLEDALDSGLIQPFSFADLGLTDEEIAQLNIGETPEQSQPPIPAETTVDTSVTTPTESFTLDDLGLADEELPSLDLGETPAVSADTSSESFTLDDLGLTDEELPSLDLGETPAVSADTSSESFSLDDLGLTDEELPSLNLGDASTSASVQEPGDTHKFVPQGDIDTLEEALDSGMVKPFSLADLGLSDEEIAQLNLGDAAIETPAPELHIADTESDTSAVDQPTLADMLDLGELSDEHVDLHLSDEKVAELKDDAAQAANQASEDFDFGLEDDLQPFSLGDFASADQASFDVGSAFTQPGLAEQNIPGISFGAESATQPGSTTESGSGDIAADRLLALGRERGYVDISDIIAAVSNPEEEAERIEMIGQLLHTNNIEIRDGDEVIDMDAEYAEEDEDEFLSPSTASTSDQPDMTPFSLAELGLSDEEIAMLGLGEQASVSPEALTFDPDTKQAEIESDIGFLDLGEDEQRGPITEPLQPMASITPLDLDLVEPEPAQVSDTGLSFSLNELDLVDSEQEPVQEATSAPVSASTPAAETSASPSTSGQGMDVFQQYLARVDQDPENHALRLSVARAAIRLGHIDVGVRQYKQLIKRNELTEDIADDLSDMIDDNDDVHVLRQLHRTLGDLFSAQGKLIEAMQLYSWTADQPKYSR